MNVKASILAISTAVVSIGVMTGTPASAQSSSASDAKCRVELKIFVAEFDKIATEAEQSIKSIVDLRDFVRQYTMPKCDLGAVVGVLRTSQFFQIMSVGRTSLSVEPLAHIRFETKSIVVRIIFKPDQSEFYHLNGASAASKVSP